MYPSLYIYPSPLIYPVSIFNQLVFDRTQDDIDQLIDIKTKIKNGSATAVERTLYLEAIIKGSYNYTDLNRVGRALNTIKELCGGSSITIDYPYPVYTNYTEASGPLNATDISHLLANVEVVRSQLHLTEITTPTSISNLNDANTIEYILYQARDQVNAYMSEYKYSNDYIAGGI